ncbi:MAG: zinc ribbon domain-containing protein [Spirochaetaceae bacterium]|jgi:DNA-directed RNA polymerase subunit RPC12/RpoP|nr:zinc ribbon domain-containing protein [Spirochaetaceae bacterium]
MAFCSNCGTQLQDGAKFCSSCGTPAGGGDPAPKPMVDKVGNIRKCPACGSEIPAMTAVCPSCGHEFSNTQVANSVQIFFEKLDAIDNDVYEREAEKERSLAGSVGGIFSSMFATGGSAGVKRKISMIEGYPIPNAKEDILEFIVFASSRFKGIKKPLPFMSVSAMSGPVAADLQMDAAWKTKCEQAYTKAKLSFGSDKDTIARIESILKEKKIIK